MRVYAQAMEKVRTATGTASRAAMLLWMELHDGASVVEVCGIWRWMITLRTTDPKVQLPAALKTLAWTARTLQARRGLARSLVASLLCPRPLHVTSDLLAAKCLRGHVILGFL